MKKNCRHCAQQFEITDEDLAFYDKVSPVYDGKKYAVPAPTLCADCRQQRRLTWRGERKLYHRKCDLCGKEIISIFAPYGGYTVYCQDCFWSDKWDPQDYARDYDPAKPFFAQFDELLKSAPLLSLYLVNPENSNFNNNSSYLKNCYLMTSSNINEDCYYGYFVNDSKDCLDCTSIRKCEKSYECVECASCYNCNYCKNTINSSDSWFLTNCVGCKNCFGCIDMRQKEYCFLNKQLTKEEYKQKMNEFNSGNRSEMLEKLKEISEFQLKFPFPHMIGYKDENVTGNSVFESKNSYNCFDCSQVENCKYCYQMMESKDCYDVMTWGRTGELFYECMGTGANGYHDLFSALIVGGIDNLYSYYCYYCKNIFGCVGQKRAEYRILNKQYSPEEYEKLVGKIIENMKASSEWGEFFPMSIAPFAYNESLVNDFLPLDEAQARKLGAKWRKKDVSNQYKGPVKKAPEKISDVQPSVTSEIFSCENCSNNYKIIPQELKFYQEKNLPIPALCHDCRHTNRLRLKNPRHLWSRKCAKCSAPIETTYSPDRPETVYCENCYLKEVY